MHGRPAAGPSIAISFLLVAVACSFAGLCYAELASMIPIAGSAYTYSYATLGEIFAWIIGWDLILEYVVSNVAVAVGFSGYSKAQLAAFGVNLPDKWASPVWASGHWTGAYFNLPGFLIVFILTLLLVRGVRESAEANNIMVMIKLGAIVTFLVVGGMLVKPANWTPFAPSGFARHRDGWRYRFLYLHRLRFGFHGGRGMREHRNATCRSASLPRSIVCTVLYVGVAIVLLGMMKYTTFVSGEAAEAPVAYALQGAGRASLLPLGDRRRRADGNDFRRCWSFSTGRRASGTRCRATACCRSCFPRCIPVSRRRTGPPGLRALPWAFRREWWTSGTQPISRTSARCSPSRPGVARRDHLLRRRQPDRPRAFRVPFVPWFPLISIVLCGGLMTGTHRDYVDPVRGLARTGLADLLLLQPATTASSRDRRPRNF